jgi:hypothetical protein
MRRTPRLLDSFLVLGLSVVGGQTFASDPPGAQAEPKVEFVGKDYRLGIVTELTKDSITIHCHEVVSDAATPGPNGATLWSKKVIPAAKEPKKFALSETLVAGEIPKEPRALRRPSLPGIEQRHVYHVGYGQMYRLSDVKVGDWVIITYSRVDGADTCDHIWIRKRPGGRVPPLPDGVEPKDIHIRYHEWMNAYWDLEDKGIPYPEKFGILRKWPAAPMPRVVNRNAIIGP